MYRNFVYKGGLLTMTLKSCNTGNYSEGGFKTISEDLTQMRSGLIIFSPPNFWMSDGTVQGNSGYNMFMDGKLVGWDLKHE